MTGARPDEAAQFGNDNINWETGEIWLLTLKKRKRSIGGLRRRYFAIKSLGPRFEELIKKLVAHPETGLFFVNRASGKPYAPRYVQEVFHGAVNAAGIVKRVSLVPYDLRGSLPASRDDRRQLPPATVRDGPCRFEGALALSR